MSYQVLRGRSGPLGILQPGGAGGGGGGGGAFGGVGNQLHLTYESDTVGVGSITDGSPVGRTITFPFGGEVTEAPDPVIGYDKSLDLTGNTDGFETTGIDFGTGDFTIEMWVYLTGFSNFHTWEMLANFGGTNTWFNLSHTSGNSGNPPNLLWDSIHGDIVPGEAGNMPLNEWHHCAVTRSGDTVTLWLNGVSMGTLALSPGDTYVGTSMFCGIGDGSPNSSQYTNMYLGPLRIDTGTARYTEAFTPPQTF